MERSLTTRWASGVAAVSVTPTAANATKSGYLTAWAGGASRPLASNLNFAPHRSIADSAVVPVAARPGANGTVSTGKLVFGTPGEQYEPHYDVTGLAPGGYRVCVDGSGGESADPGGFADRCCRAVVRDGTSPPPAGSAPVAVRAGVETAGIDFHLPRR